MGHPYIISLKNFEPINPAEIFGRDANRILKACDVAFNNWLHKYENCYRSTSRPTFQEVREEAKVNGENFSDVYKAAIANWKFANPEEAEKEMISRKEWEENRDKQFRIIYGIACRHGLYLEWHGNSTVSCGDQWTVYRNNERIARICCL